MNWTTPEDIRARLMRAWERGDLLRAVLPTMLPATLPATRVPNSALPSEIRSGMAFPHKIPLRGPRFGAMTASFEQVREWVAQISSLSHVRIEWRSLRHRVHGDQRIPAAAWIDDAWDAILFLDKRAETEHWNELRERTSESVPALLGWTERRPLQALALRDRWPMILATVRWCQAHPRSDRYLRQIDAPGVDSKFVEAHRGVLAELLDIALPADAIDARRPGGAAGFHGRYGFREKPPRLRFRMLDPQIPVVPGATGNVDITLDLFSFRQLDLPVRRIFITENETNFLAFPPAPESIIVFGAGYAIDLLAQVTWLSNRRIIYWGDIDTHGFAILDRLRTFFPRTTSLMMDEKTFFAHRALWGREQTPSNQDLVRLSPDERALFDFIRRDRIGESLRLEQERIGFDWVVRETRDIVEATPEGDG